MGKPLYIHIPVLILFLADFYPVSAEQIEKAKPVYIVFTSSMVAEMNPRDAVAAVQVFGDQIIKRRKLSGSPVIKICDGKEELRNLLKREEADVVALCIDEYLSLESSALLGSGLAGLRNENWAEQYVLLVRTADGIRKLADLNGKRLTTLYGRRMGLALQWLNIQLQENNLPDYSHFFGQIKQSTKTSGAILPVFFKQADACLATQSGFETMVQLNPQIGKQLLPIKISPSVLPSLICLRRNLDAASKESYRQALLDLDVDAGGRQVLTLFSLDKLIPIAQAHISNALEIFFPNKIKLMRSE
jgi:phosphonate transport system substrate-binding protein